MAEHHFQQSASRQIRDAVAAYAISQTDSTGQAQARTLPGPERLAAARQSLPDPLVADYLTGRGPDATLNHILSDIAPALTGQNFSGRYYGFVTGSTLPIAEVADNIVTAFDQNVQVHLPEQTIATEVEDAAHEMLLALLELGDRSTWQGRVFTTGATGSNILGLACGREFVVSQALQRAHKAVSTARDSVGELGLLQACAQAGIKQIQVLTSMGHSSLSKAAGIVGLGRASVKELPQSAEEPWRLNLDAVEEELRTQQARGVVNIIVVSAGEVNTSNFAVAGLGEMRRLRAMADRYGAWIHVDGAFAIFARLLPKSPEFTRLRELAAGIELADSITADGHKVLNVPYDCGIFYTRSATILQDVCKNPNAAYLASSSSSSSSSSASRAFEIQSPLNIGLENSRRFRALPVYATLLSEGREGLAEMVVRMVRLARRVAQVVDTLEAYELLASAVGQEEEEEGAEGETVAYAGTGFVVLFRAKDEALNEVLVKKIHESQEWYVSGTKWDGKPACRIAVSSWRVNVEEDAEFIKGQLEKLAREHGK